MQTAEVTVQTKSVENSSSLLAGAITGQIAGLIMAVAVMAVFVIFYGRSPLYPVQVIGSTVFGGEALQGFHFGAVLAGLLLHQLGPALAWGLLFGAVVGKIDQITTKQSLILGLMLGAVSMIDVYVFVPAVMHALHGVDYWNQEIPMFWDWVAHLVFGISFSLYPKVAQKLQSKM